MVAGYAAQAFAENGLAPGELAIVSADPHMPYERPPLSKGFLAGEETPDGILINDQDFYTRHGIDWVAPCRVSRVDFDARIVSLEDGRDIEYERLLIATGATARRLDVPGADDHAFYLRTVHDAEQIRDRAATAKTAVTIGAGFISMEVASVLARRGLNVTMVYPDSRVWSRLFTPEISAFFERYYTDRGVRLCPRESVEAIDGSGVRVTSGESIPADMVVAGIGIEPALGLFRGSGLRTNGEILVNEYLETNIPDVYAAGDVVRYRDLLYGTARRADHWDNAVEQGRHAARVMAGDRAPFIHVPYFFSDVFDLSYEFWGDTDGADTVVYRGDVGSGAFSAWWLRRHAVIAAFVMNRPDEEREAAPRWIAERQQVDVRRLEEDAELEAASRL